MSKLTDEQIRIIGASMPPENKFHSRAFARAIESAATEPLLQQIAELERQLDALRAQIGQVEPVGTAISYYTEDGHTKWTFQPTKLGWEMPQDSRANERGARSCFDVYTHPAPQQKPIGWLYDWTHSSALGKPDEHFTSFTTDEEHARKHSNARPVFESANNIGEEK